MWQRGRGQMELGLHGPFLKIKSNVLKMKSSKIYLDVDNVIL
jgi:hypothetical protein